MMLNQGEIFLTYHGAKHGQAYVFWDSEVSFLSLNYEQVEFNSALESDNDDLQAA